MNSFELRALVDRIKASIEIAEIVGSRIQLNRSLKACCPFHEDKNPSFCVNQKGQYFHCFGCGVGGDVIKFLMLFDGKSFVEALVGLAEQVGIDVPKSLRGR